MLGVTRIAQMREAKQPHRGLSWEPHSCSSVCRPFLRLCFRDIVPLRIPIALSRQWIWERLALEQGPAALVTSRKPQS